MQTIKTIFEAEREAILAACKVKKTCLEAAEALGVSRATLYRLLKKHNISPTERRGLK